MNDPHDPRGRRTALIALCWLLGLGGMALFGPWGLLSWSEKASQLEDRQARIAMLREDAAVLENRVELLDPDNVDPDLATELVRRDLNVLHRDEYVIEFDDTEQR